MNAGSPQCAIAGFEAVTLHPAQQGRRYQPLAAAWIPDDPDGARLLNQAGAVRRSRTECLVLHGVRVVAAAGATLYVVARAGLAALQRG
ncbi:MAG: hypothetical protein H6672_20705 [Anaerolineaceae bacterium]|nr:hypothetical protein [Anaerolineaceae bacterium]